MAMTANQRTALREAVRAHFGSRLALLGLVRRGAGEDYLWAISHDLSGWFNPVLSGRRAWLDALPYVGVGSEAVEAMVRRLGGDGGRGANHGGTVMETLTVVAAEPGISFEMRVFEPHEPVEPYADWIVEGFARWGVPWVEAHASLERLLDANPIVRPGAPFVDVRRLAIFLLLGDRAAALEYLEKVQDEARQRPFDPNGEHLARVAMWASRLSSL
jgi:hypothetical protein